MSTIKMSAFCKKANSSCVFWPVLLNVRLFPMVLGHMKSVTAIESYYQNNLKRQNRKTLFHSLFKGPTLFFVYKIWKELLKEIAFPNLFQTSQFFRDELLACFTTLSWQYHKKTNDNRKWLFFVAIVGNKMSRETFRIKRFLTKIKKPKPNKQILLSEWRLATHVK